MSLRVLHSKSTFTGSGSSICLTSKSIRIQVIQPSNSPSYSVVTGTPPSIREDATIHIAPEILKGVDVSSSVLEVLAEAELCLLWGKVSRSLSL